VVEGMFVDIILLHAVSLEKHPVVKFKRNQFRKLVAVV
jgi:hypothetical protein